MIFRHGWYLGFVFFFSTISAPRRSLIFLAMAVPSILVAAMAEEVVANCLTGGFGGLRLSLGGFELLVCEVLEAVDVEVNRVRANAAWAEERAV